MKIIKEHLMDSWYSLEITGGDLAKATMQRVMDAFMPKYVGSGRPSDMAIFSSHNKALNTWTLYFSPKALSLALRFGASRFDGEFVDQDLDLLAGDAKSIDILFPDAKTKTH
jgi:hypothetical protein